MIDTESIANALGQRLLTLSVCTTGSIALAATAAGYTRAVGSFYTDGFRLGMEILAAGFVKAANNGLSVIVGMTDTTLDVAHKATPTVVESSAGGRTLSVGLPSLQAWENFESKPAAGVPFLEEQFHSGVEVRINNGELEIKPTYWPRIHVPIDTGRGAAMKYADALTALFPQSFALVVGSGVLRVRGDAAPQKGQLVPSDSGFAFVPVTIPLWYRTPIS